MFTHILQAATVFRLWLGTLVFRLDSRFMCPKRLYITGVRSIKREYENCCDGQRSSELRLVEKRTVKKAPSIAWRHKIMQGR